MKDSLFWSQIYNLDDDDSYPISFIVQNNESYILSKVYSDTMYINILKYDANGNLLWNQTYDHGLNNYVPYYIYSSGDFLYILANYYDVSIESYGIITLKYDTDGNLLWNQTYNNPSEPQGLIFGQGYGNAIYELVIGNSRGYDKVLLLKYDTEGNLLWNQTYDTAEGTESACSFTIYNNELYILYTQNKNGNSDIGLLKYDANGNLLWNQTYDYSTYDGPKSIRQYGGDIYILGEGYLSNYDSILLKYDTEGNLLWNQTYDYKNQDNEPKYLLISNNRLYTIGYETCSPNGIISVTYDTDGNLLWNQTFDYKKIANEVVSATLLNDELYLLCNGIDNNQNILLLKYGNNGNLLWNQTYDYKENYDEAKYMGISNDNIHILGTCYSDVENILSLKYDLDGNLINNNTFNFNNVDTTSKRMVVSKDNVFILGKIWNVTNYGLVLLRYGVDTTAPYITINSPNGTLKTDKFLINVSSYEGLVTSGIKEVIANINNENITLTKTGDYYLAEKTLNDGTYLLNVTSIDNANNSNSTSTTFTIDTYVPSSNNNNRRRTIDASDSIESKSLRRTVSDSTVVYGSNFDKQLANSLKENTYSDDTEIDGDTIILGGPVSNRIANQYNDRFTIPVTNDNPGENRGIIQVISIPSGSSTIVQSYKLIYIAGSDRLGTEAALKYFETLTELPDEPITVEWVDGGFKVIE
ncbi:hypothetical protein J3E07_001704 [Methanococcus voltae]|uniref:S-layer protein outer domain-containing protein n=1 Tax=Methanococcus voltae TaxID=2188 RepID=A0A8J7S6E6_METVO|nr:hypothetical protein [Methanococcus voltae]MBP2202263.1 hypothetical protein [Methanococcus voltae]